MAQICMGPAYGLDDVNAEVLRKFRWIFRLPGVIASDNPFRSIRTLPPRKASRPKLQFKSQEFQHLTESIHVPMKADWQTINLTLFDVKRCGDENKYNVVFDWIRNSQQGQDGKGIYNPESGTWVPFIDAKFKRTAELSMLDGCGNELETWVFENAYVESADWGELEMEISDVVAIEITLRYDRAYQTI
jgi:hypothetical protein